MELCQQLMEGLRQRHLAEESRQDVIQTSTRQTFQPQQVKFEMFSLNLLSCFKLLMILNHIRHVFFCGRSWTWFLCVHVSHRVRVWLLQPLVSRVESLERVLDLCSGLGGAAQAACDLQPAADALMSRRTAGFSSTFAPHLSVNKRFLPQTVNLRRGHGEHGVTGAQREAAQRDSGFWSSFHSQAQEVQERSTCVRFPHFSPAEAFVSRK